MNKILLSLIFLLELSLPAHAIVTSLINKNIIACDGTRTTFQYTFPIVDIANASDLQIYQFDSTGNQSILTTNYSVNTTTGTVTYPVSGTTCPSGYTIVLLRVEPLTQGVAASYQGPGPTPPVMQMSDKLTMISQQLQEQSNRALLLPVNSSSAATFPGANPGYLIGWNGSGVLSNINNPSAVAQWTLNATNISYNLGNVSTVNSFSAGNLFSTGNTGIGTTIPDRLLDVVSSDTDTTLTTASLASMGIKNLNSATSNNFADMAFSTTDTNGSIQMGSKISGIFTSHAPSAVSGGLVFMNKTSGTTAEAMRIIGGNVGIGSLVPGQKLDVNGTVRSTSFVQTGSLINNFTGNVGIGSTAPGQSLDVVGTIKATNFSGPINSPYVKISNTQASGTGGGAATVGGWSTSNILPFNTKDFDTSSIATLTSNQITLPAGTYQVSMFILTNSVNLNQFRLCNASGTVLLNGSSGYNTSPGIIRGQITLGASTTLIFEYQVQTHSGNNDFGNPTSFGTEVYGQAEFTKII